MPKAVQLQHDQYYYHYPAVATIVTSHADGNDNAMAVAWHTAISREPPIYGVSISPKRYTHGLIVASGEFVVNFVPWEKRELVAKVAGCSGREVQKFQAFGIAVASGKAVQVPVLADAYAAYECRVMEQRVMGDHDLFVGSIVAVHWNGETLNKGNMLDPEQAHPVLYLGGDCYATAKGNVLLDRVALAKAAAGAVR
ncbi:MAG: flavin reductase family protein [Pseudomonadota bacterium]